jgi:hypothetical protein
MKKSIILFAILAVALLAACNKDDGPQPDNGYRAIRFEFTSDVPAAYKLSATAGTAGADEVINGTTWSKTLAASKSGGADTASLFVLPPDSWMGTDNRANVTMRILVNDVVRASKSIVMVWLDRPADYNIKAAY